MKYFWLSVFLVSSQAIAENSIFRDPFVLQLPVDDERYYEQKFDKVPFVHENTVLLFNNEKFGIDIKPSENGLFDIVYKKDYEKADVILSFSQTKLDKNLMMILEIKNNTKKTLTMDGLMTVPGKKGVKSTSIIPIQAGLSSFESWPHPIVQLALKGIQLK